MKIIILNIMLVLFTTLSFGQSFEDLISGAEQGDVDAQFNLGVLYYNGEGTLTDKKSAAYWMKLSYENGIEEAKQAWEAWELWKY